MAQTDKLAKLFKFDPKDSIASLLKAGVLKSFRHYSKQPEKTTEQVRHDIANSLRSLTDIVVLPPGEGEKTSKRKKEQPIQFYSAHQGALVETVRDTTTNRLMTERFVVNKSDGLNKNERNENFKNDVAGHALNMVDNDIVKTVLNGIYTTLEKAEDTVGPFIEQFEQHVEMFEQLAVIFEHAEEENLAKGKGCYNHALAVDEGMRALGYS